jgi:putative ATPase
LQLLEDAIHKDKELSKRKITLQETEALLRLSGGDARKLLNVLELVIQSSPEGDVTLTDAFVLEHVQQNLALYDKAGEQHYDIISAFIKSMRGSDPNAAVYWLARMLEGGEDPLFIARRMIILASEDIGNANPTALVIANNAFQAVNIIGLPEGRIILSQAVVYLASSPKSNASYKAIEEALEMVRQTGNQPVPLPIRNAPTKLMKELGYGDEYKYAHAYENNFALQEFLPDAVKGVKFYDPGNNAREREIREFLKKRWGEKYGY